MKFNVGDKVKAIELSYPPGGFPELTVGQLYSVEEVIGAKGNSIIIAERIDIGTQWENFKTAREFDSSNFELVEPALKLIERPIKEVTFETQVLVNGIVQQLSLESMVGKQVIVTVKIKE